MCVCASSKCSNASWDCGGIDCSKNIRCPSNQVYLRDVRRCGRTCATYDDTADFCSAANEPIFDGCACPSETVLSPNVSSRSICRVTFNSLSVRDRMRSGADLNGDNLRICASVIKVGLGLGLRIYGTDCWRSDKMRICHVIKTDQWRSAPLRILSCPVVISRSQEYKFTS